MKREELDRGFEFIAATTDARMDEVQSALTVLADAIGVGESRLEFPALDRRIIGEGGYAFRWEDVLEIGELCEILVSGTGGILLPNQLAAVLKSLLQSWQRLRKARVELSEVEFKIIRAVSRGYRDFPAIVKLTGLSDEVVRKVVSELLTRKYGEAIPLVEADEQGLLSTKF